MDKTVSEYPAATVRAFSILGEVVPSGAPMRALLMISDSHDKLRTENARLRKALRGCLTALTVAQERAESDVYGAHHNAAVDALRAAEAALKGPR